jgi:hypothetical protein
MAVLVVRLVRKRAVLQRSDAQNSGLPGAFMIVKTLTRKEQQGVVEAPFRDERGSTMPATLKVTHKAIGVEVRRGPYDVVVDGERAGSVEMNHTIEIPVEPGRHTLQVRDGRDSSSTETFDAAEEEIVAFRCTGKRFLPIFLASFVVPKLALKLVRD